MIGAPFMLFLSRWLSLLYKRQRAVALPVIIVSVLSMIGVAQRQTTSSSIRSGLIPDEVRGYVPLTADDVSVVVLTGTGSPVILAAWSKPSKDMPGFDASVVAVRGTGIHTKRLWHLRLAGGYSPKLVEKSDFKYRGKPIVLLQTQFGAAVAQLDVIGIHDGKIRHLGSVEADYFEYLNIADATYLVAHDDVNLLDVPRLYRWSGASFTDDSVNHPEFYKELAVQIKDKSDVAKFAPPVQLRYAQILRLSAEQPTTPAR